MELSDWLKLIITIVTVTLPHPKIDIFRKNASLVVTTRLRTSVSGMYTCINDTDIIKIFSFHNVAIPCPRQKPTFIEGHSAQRTQGSREYRGSSAQNL